MSLSKHIHADALLQQSKDHKHSAKHLMQRNRPDHISPSYAGRYETEPIPRHKIPSEGVDADAAYRIVRDITEDLDGRPNLNLASFVHTSMPPQATQLMIDNMSKNLIDEDEYPGTVSLHHRVISMCGHLWHAQHHEHPIGTATTGSSEGIILGALALKRNWQNRRKAAGKDTHTPNIIMGANAQVCLEKAATYLDVERRMVPVTEKSRYCLDVEEAIKMCDDNTIGVFVILGSTYTGHYEQVKEMSDALDKYEKETGNYIPIHVDGASGAFFAPFATPQLKWDFQLPRVVSIQGSGHKFGLAYVGVGIVVWRDKKHLPKDLIFELHYLGSVELSFSLNFSRPAAPVIALYWSLLHLGFAGYRRIALADLANARLLSRALERSGVFKVLSEIHRTLPGKKDDGEPESYAPGLPVVAFRFTDEWQKKYPHVQQKWIQTLLRAKSWIVPNYALPPTLDQTEILRVVVRESTSEDLLEALVTDLMEIIEQLQQSDSSTHALATLGGDSRSSATHPDKGPKDKNVPKAGEGVEGQQPTGFGRPC